MTNRRLIQAQVDEVMQFATWLAGAFFLLLIGRAIGKAEKNMVNYLLDAATPEEIPVRIPQTKLVTVTCPICGEVIEIPEYNAVTRTDALRRHIEKEHGPKISSHPQALAIEGGEPVPAQYRDLVSLVNEPLPEYALLTTFLPAVEVATGERKIDAVMKQLKEGVEGIQESAQFRLFLTTMSKFHDYSIGNLILIGLQKPDATRVAGFNTWKELGRWVKKGERGIAILAPVMPPRPTCPQCGARLPKGARFCPKCGAEVEAEEGIEATPRFFRVVYVFDLSQTEGRELPEFDVPVLTGEANEELFVKLKALMKQKGVTVSFEPRGDLPPELKGQFIPPNLIWVRPDEPPAQQLKTLLHEVAHYYSAGVFQLPRADAETIAESAAYVVGAHYGFDTGVRSFPYVALWAQDKKVLERNLTAVRNVANAILEDFEKYGLEKMASPQLQTVTTTRTRFFLGQSGRGASA